MLGILSGTLTPDAHTTQALNNCCINAHLTEWLCAWVNRFNLMAQGLLPRKWILHMCHLMTHENSKILSASFRFQLNYCTSSCNSPTQRPYEEINGLSVWPLALLWSYQNTAVHCWQGEVKGLEINPLFLKRVKYLKKTTTSVCDTSKAPAFITKTRSMAFASQKYFWFCKAWKETSPSEETLQVTCTRSSATAIFSSSTAFCH